MSVHLLRADARTLPFADNTVDLIVTSPPFYALRSYTDNGEHYAGQLGDEDTPHAFVDALLDVTRECVRVLKPSGSLWVNLGDKYSGAQAQTSSGVSNRNVSDSAAFSRKTDPRRTGIPNKSLLGIPWRYALRCIDDLGLILRAEVVWSKPNGLPESVTDRVRRSHEQWFHFTVQPRYYSNVDAIREAYTAAPFRGQKRHDAGQAGATRNPVLASLTSWDASSYNHNPLGKLPGSVWTIPTQPLIVPADLGVDHFAAFPMEWPRRIIQGWCPPGGTVLDPFGGTGTTALVADVLGRRGISVDLSSDYLRLARWRTTDPRQRASAAQVDPPAAQTPGQLSLLDGGAA